MNCAQLCTLVDHILHCLTHIAVKTSIRRQCIYFNVHMLSLW
jgi:hypothetical protein